MAYFNLNLFRGGRLVQVDQMHSFTGTKRGAINHAAKLLVSESLDRVTVESKSGLIVATVKPERKKR